MQKNILQIIKFAFIIVLDATVAQLVEQLIRNQQVAGSNPASSSKTRRNLKIPAGFLV